MQLEKCEVKIIDILRGYLAIEHKSEEMVNVSGNLYIDDWGPINIDFNNNKNTRNVNGKTVLFITAPKNFLDAQPHAYYIKLKFNGIKYQTEPKIISYPVYKIHIDSIESTTISGWIIKSHNEKIELNLISEINEKLEVIDGIERHDVPSNTKNKNVGFSFRNQVSVDGTRTLILQDKINNINILRFNLIEPYDSLQELAKYSKNSSSFKLKNITNSLLPALLKNIKKQDIDFIELKPRKIQSEKHPEIAIIIPVYEGYKQTVECIESVLSANNTCRYRLIIINDNSPNQSIQKYLTDIEKSKVDNVVIINCYKNSGFSNSVNLGMLVAGSRDVILLNSDTVVQDGWIDRMVAAAISMEDIGTVTPLSNNAEICTIPYSCDAWTLTDNNLAKRIDEQAANVNKGKTKNIPVAVGFCMYIKRRCLQEIGLFDAEKWGRGYGEEVDFCLKATVKGWRHVLAADVFVTHQGAVSFANEKKQLVEESGKKLQHNYPYYDAHIQHFLKTDLVNPFRRNINLTFVDKQLNKNRILHISHSYQGGIKQYVDDQYLIDDQESYSSFILNINDDGCISMRFRLETTEKYYPLKPEHVEYYDHSELEELKKDLSKLKILKVHLHSPFGLPIAFLNWIVDSYPTKMTIHDYSWICPRVTLTQSNGKYCGEPSVTSCNKCVHQYGSHPGLSLTFRQAGNDVEAYRQQFIDIFKKLEVVYASAQDVISRMIRYGFEANFIRQAHPHPKTSVFLQEVNLPKDESDSKIIKVALIGGISDIKGFHQLVDCAKTAREKNLQISFIVFGKTRDDTVFEDMDNVFITGTYKNEHLESLMLQYRPHLSFFPNQWPETHSYTLTHALRLGLWPVVAGFGAPAERVRNQNFGTVYDRELNSSQILDLIIDVHEQRSKYKKNNFYIKNLG